MELKDYYNELENHDWFYEYSDDQGVWERGRDSLKNIQTLSKNSDEHQKLYDGFCKHHFSGKPWGIEKQPKPEIPLTNE